MRAYPLKRVSVERGWDGMLAPSPHGYLRSLARYTEWANAVLYDACVRLMRAAYHAAPARGASVHVLLNRMLVHYRITQARLDGYEPQAVDPDAEQHKTFARMRDALVAEDVAFVGRVRHLSDAELELPVTYADEGGVRHTNSQGELVLELLLRQTGLRGAACERMSESGVEPPDLGFTRFLREAD